MLKDWLGRWKTISISRWDIFYSEKTKEFFKKVLELIIEFSRVIIYKIKI